MKKIFFTVLVALICLRATSQAPSNTVNAVLGDQSFIETFGTFPVANTDELLRITTHLQYVENLLRQKNTDHLSAAQKKNRDEILQLLKEYTSAGIFPSNYDYPDERRPCFIDRNGNICAVGYLVEQTAGRELAEAINREHQYDYILEMDVPAIQSWADEYGLTPEECAMIQPAYPPGSPLNPHPSNYVEPAYGISSGILGGSNIAFTMINVMQIQKGAGKKTAPVLGLITGTAQLVMGIAKTSNHAAEYDGKSVKTLHYFNIALGTSSIITSAWNLLANRKPKEKTTSVNLFSYPNPANSLTVGFSFTKRI